jgi:hypothetical protein
MLSCSVPLHAREGKYLQKMVNVVKWCLSRHPRNYKAVVPGSWNSH